MVQQIKQAGGTMPVRLETDLEKRVVKAAEQKGWWALKLVAVGHRGFPDRWFIRPAAYSGQQMAHPEIVLIEFKAFNKRTRKLQDYVLDKLQAMGFEVHRNVDTWEKAKEILEL